MDLETDIERLEQGIRLLKVQYDQYFAGSLPKQPLELRAEVERILRHYTNNPVPSLQHRFHLSTLASRFNTFAELWTKHLRAKEEGRPLPGTVVPVVRAVVQEATPEAEPAASRPAILAQRLLSGEDPDPAAVRDLYDDYLVAKRGRTELTGTVSFNQFSRQVLQKAEAVKNRTACDAVRLRLAVDGDRLTLTAVPVRRRKDP